VKRPPKSPEVSLAMFMPRDPVAGRREYERLLARLRSPALGPVRCPSCRKQGYLVRLAVRRLERPARLRYEGRWEHPDRDGESTGICDWWWD
jgi:hypothetical protein